MRHLLNLLPILWTAADLACAAAVPFGFAQDETEISNTRQQHGSSNGKREQHRLRFVSTENTDQNKNAPQRRELQSSACGIQCFANSSCDGECAYCDGFVCYNPYKCGQTCSSNSECSFSKDGCFYCNNNICSQTDPCGGDDRTCVNNVGVFQSALNNPDVSRITICQNAIISLTGTGDAFMTNRSNFAVDCQAGVCQFIRKGGSGRIFNFPGSGIELKGLTFDNGTAGGDGGAVYIGGASNRIENCVFRDNSATGDNANGGAVSWADGVLVSSRGFNNVAQGTCNGVYYRNTGQCDISVNESVNVDQCQAFCSNVQNCGSRPGQCLNCDFNTNMCTLGQPPSQCNNPCNFDSDCNSLAGPCIRCNTNSKRCEVDPGPRTCVSNESMLRTGLQDTTASSAVVEVCTNAKIELSSEIMTSASNKTLRCQGGARTCTIARNANAGSQFRLLNFSGNNIVLADIIFSNGKVSGDGGAVLLSGTGNTVRNVEFDSNTASQRGGALSMGQGTLIDCDFAGNSAAQCTNAYIISSGSCEG